MINAENNKKIKELKEKIKIMVKNEFIAKVQEKQQEVVMK